MARSDATMTEASPNDLIDANPGDASYAKEGSPELPIHALTAEALQAQGNPFPRPIRYRHYRDDSTTPMASPTHLPPAGPPDNKTISPNPKLTIVDSSVLTTLKEHNSILRSHNLSLATQNKNLRIEGINMVEALRKCEPAQREIKALKGQNTALTEENARLEEENDAMNECGIEWARREKVVVEQAQGWKQRCEKMMGVLAEQKAKAAEVQLETDARLMEIERLEDRVEQYELEKEQQRAGIIAEETTEE